jgi:hypothetical protein
MGTTLHAIVEIHEPEVPGVAPARWDTVSTWQLDKLYDLMAVLSERKAFVPWPPDVAFEAREVARVRDEDCQIFKAQDLPIRKFENGEKYASLRASLAPLIKQKRYVRVLFYRR